MKLFPVNVTESFTTNNPVNRLYGKLIPLWKARGADGFLTICTQTSLLILIAWGICFGYALNDQLNASVHQWYSKVSSISLLLLLIPAFLAPAAGAAIRSKLDHNPLIKEALATSLKPREYVAAMHARILYPAFTGALLMLVVALSLYFFWVFAPALHSETLRQSLLRMFYWPIDPMHYPAPAGIVWYGLAPVAAVVMALTFGAGIYLRMSLLCRIPQNSEFAKSRGGSLTTGLLLAMIVSLCLRLMLINMMNSALRMNEIDGGPIAVLIIEIPVLVFRFYWARKQWLAMLDEKTGLGEEFRTYVLND